MQIEAYRRCPTCGVVLTRHPNEKPGRFAGRQFCSVQCSKITPCRVCGARRPKVESGGNRPHMAGLCRECYRARMVRPHHGQGLPSRTTAGYLHRFAPDHLAASPSGFLYQHHEVWCDAHGPIPAGHHVHHINGNRADNRLENLEMVNPKEHYRRHHPIGSLQINQHGGGIVRR